MKIVTKFNDGRIGVTALHNGVSFEECFQKWPVVLRLKYVSHREMPDEAIPVDITFRNAWADTTPDAVVDIDMAKARGIHLERIRVKRNAELKKLDIDAIKAQDAGDDARLAEVRARKQELRDLPETIAPTLDAARTVEELKAIQPL